MVTGLDERFKQSCVAACVLRGLAEHFEKQPGVMNWLHEHETRYPPGLTSFMHCRLSSL